MGSYFEDLRVPEGWNPTLEPGFPFRGTAGSLRLEPMFPNLGTTASHFEELKVGLVLMRAVEL